MEAESAGSVGLDGLGTENNLCTSKTCSFHVVSGLRRLIYVQKAARQQKPADSARATLKRGKAGQRAGCLFRLARIGGRSTVI